MGDLCTKVGEREMRQKSVSLPPKAGELVSLPPGKQHTNLWVSCGSLGVLSLFRH